MTNRKRGQLDELCMDHDPGASPASDPDDLEDVGKRLERCAGKGRSGSNHRVVALHCCVPDRRGADLAGLSHGISQPGKHCQHMGRRRDLELL